MKIRFIDLFCGIGGFRLGATQALESREITPECVFSSDIDLEAQKAYEANFGEKPAGDIKKVDARDVPDH
ncbi:MAG: DNA-methyltransferase Dcm, partial [Chthonomonadales bacterium]|nr:DNA-methyltransferase Dcm [Chthonomonadales bacterium]